MDYLSLIDEMELENKIDILLSISESVPYRVLSEGTITDTIKSIFKAIKDFFIRIKDFIVGIFKKSEDKEDREIKYLSVAKNMDVELAKKKLSEYPEGTISIWIIKDYGKKIERHNEIKKIANSIDQYINDVKIKSNAYICNGKGEIPEFNERFKKQIDFVKQTKETIGDDKLVNVPFTDYNFKEMKDTINQSLDELSSFRKEIDDDFKKANDISEKAIKYADEATKYTTKNTGNNLNDNDKLQKVKYVSKQIMDAGGLLATIIKNYQSEIRLINYSSDSIGTMLNKLTNSKTNDTKTK